MIGPDVVNIFSRSPALFSQHSAHKVSRILIGGELSRVGAVAMGGALKGGGLQLYFYDPWAISNKAGCGIVSVVALLRSGGSLLRFL